MKKILLLICLIGCMFQAGATGEPSTRFNIFVPPNNDPVHRDVCLIVTAMYDSTSFTIIDDSLDGDNDDTKSGILMAGQSYILYIRDNGINDDARYASGGVWKQDGDYFTITSNKLVFASQSTNSDWQHDWVPSVNKSSLGEKFIIYAPLISSSKRDLNVFAYTDSTFVTIKKISKSPTTITGYTNVDMNEGTIVLQQMLHRGQDLIYKFTGGRDIMLSGETYVIECSKPSTVQYGALWGNERDGGGYVPTSNGSSSGELMYFAVPYQSGSSGEQEIRIVSWDDNNVVTLERYNNGSWVSMKSWTVNKLKAVDWVGRNNGNVNYANTFRITCSAGKKVSVFEGNWFETGSVGTSDMATMVSSETGTTAGKRFLSYMAPPGNEQNVRNPFTGNLFTQRLTHVYLFAGTDTAHVTVKDAYTNGSKFSKSYSIEPGRYVDCYLTETEWKNIYNGTGTNAGPERPYVLIESDEYISVMNTNFNDNWMMYFGTSLEQSFDMSSSSTKEYTKPGDTLTVSTSIQLNTSQTVSDVSIEVVAQTGLQVVSSTFNDATSNTTINGVVTPTATNTTVAFNNIPDLNAAGSYTVQTTIVTQVSTNTGAVVPNNAVLNIETITSGMVNGALQQSVATESVTLNSSNTSSMMFSAYANNTFSDTTDSWTCSCVDVNNDGYDDVFFSERDKSKTNLLYLNNKSGGFAKQITGSLLAEKSTTVSNTWGDADNDGDLDLLTISDTYKPNRLHLNNGSGSFSSAEHIPFTKEVSYYHGASWVDYDRDGYLDVFISNYMPTRFNELYHNERNGTFTKVDDGVLSLSSSDAVGSTWADYDNDGNMDLFIPNNRKGSNQLFHNDGGGKFTEVKSGVIVADGGYSVGSCWGDIDNDGDLDLFVTNASDQNNYLYINIGNGTFMKNTTSSVVNDKGHSHGCSFVDVDNDADLDLYVTNDNGFKFLYLNDGSGNFSKKTNELVTADYGKAFGQTWCDFDHDGDLDLFVATHSKQLNKVFTNNCSGKNWIEVKLIGTQSNGSAVGARVYVKTDSVWQMHEVTSQSGFGGQNSYRQHFGLGSAGVIDSIRIVWPSMLVDNYIGINVNQLLTYTERNTQKVSGLVFNDANNNCTQDSLEAGIPYAEVKVGTNKLMTNNKGEFAVQLVQGTYGMQVVSNGFVDTTICSNAQLTVSNAPISNLFLPARSNCQQADIMVTMGTTALRRGFSNTIKVTLTNKGQQTCSAYTLTLSIDPNLVFKSASSLWNTKSTAVLGGENYTTYSWTMSALEPGEEITLNIIDSVELTAVVGHYAKLICEVTGIAGDCDPTNNTLILNEKIVGAIDPNEKYVYPEGVIKSNQLLTYKIEFQNVGNYPASFVIVTDRLSPLLDPSTLKMVSSSHLANTTIEGNLVTWFFEDINLVDSTTNKEGSEGFLVFTILPIKEVNEGQKITNQASIVFDYNDPVLTAITCNTIQQQSVLPVTDILVFPNPATDEVSIKLVTGKESEPSLIVDIEICTLYGKRIRSKQIEGSMEVQLNLTGIEPGLYVIHSRLMDGSILSKKMILR
jgi:uncharacterized repeat protein (TIGR01451 family)